MGQETVRSSGSLVAAATVATLQGEQKLQTARQTAVRRAARLMLRTQKAFGRSDLLGG